MKIEELLVSVIALTLLWSISGHAQQQRPARTGTLVETTSNGTTANDVGKNIVMNCASSPCMVTPPRPPPTNTWQIDVSNPPSARVPTTLSPNGLTLDASSGSSTIHPGTGLIITTHGTNYFFQRSLGSSSIDCSKFSGATFDIQLTACIMAGGNGAHLVVPPGSYLIANEVNISGVTGLTLELDKSAALTAAAGLGSNPMLNITAASSGITVKGGKWNGNSVAAACIFVGDRGGGTSNITIDGIECYGAAGAGGIFIRGTPGPTAFDISNVTVKNSYVHHVAGGGIVEGAAVNSRFLNNIVYSVGMSGIQVAGISDEIAFNKVSRWSQNPSGVIAGIKSNLAVGTDVHDNTVVGAAGLNACAYFDVVFSGNIHDNEFSGCDNGVRLEINRDTVFHGNRVHDLSKYGSYGLLANSRIETTVKNALTATTGLTAGSNVTLSTDATNPPPLQRQSVKAALGAGFTTGNIFHQDFGSDTSWQTPILQLYVYSDTDLPEGTLQLLVASDGSFAVPVSRLKMPHIYVNQWALVEVWDPQWGGLWSSPGIRSWGINATSILANANVHVSQFQTVVPYGPVTITGNTFERTGSYGIYVETLTGFTIEGNTITDPGFYNTTCSAGCIGLLLQTGGLSATAGQVLANGQVRDNIFRITTPNAATGKQAIRARMLNGGVGSNIFINGNDLSAYPAAQATYYDIRAYIRTSPTL